MEEFFCRIRGNAITQSWLSPTKAFNLEGDPNKDLPPSLPLLSSPVKFFQKKNKSLTFLLYMYSCMGGEHMQSKERSEFHVRLNWVS